MFLRKTKKYIFWSKASYLTPTHPNISINLWSIIMQTKKAVYMFYICFFYFVEAWEEHVMFVWKEKLTQPMVMSWITTKFCFAIVNLNVNMFMKMKNKKGKTLCIRMHHKHLKQNNFNKIVKFWKFQEDSMIYKHKNLVKQWHCFKINCSK